MSHTRMMKYSKGFTLLELMIVVAVIAIIAAVAIPGYFGYLSQSRKNAARANMDPLRAALEEYRLDNGGYPVGNKTELGGTTEITAALPSWSHAGDDGAFGYYISATATNYHIVVHHTKSSDYARCDNRMGNCCDGNATFASAKTTGC